MKGPSLRKTAALSAVLHVTFFLISVVALKYSAHRALPSPYIVTLLGPLKMQQDRSDTSSAVPAEMNGPASSVVQVKSQQRKERADEDMISTRIRELEAGQAIKRIEASRSLLSVRGKKPDVTAKTSSHHSGGSSRQGTPDQGSYTDRIIAEIWSQWIFPDQTDKQLEAIVSIKIMKDGAITIYGFEKKSGNLLFDRSVMNAILKAEPVTPPPYEMELGIRFYP